MTSGAQLPENKPVKLALCGDSGTRKTVSVVPLILAGYKLRVIDVDNGVDIILNALHNSASPFYALAQKIDLEQNFRYETITHKMITLDDGARVRIQPSDARVFPKVEKLIHEWKEESTGLNLGPITKWDSDTILVLDSSTFCAYAAFAYSQQLNKRLGSDPSGNTWRRDIGAAQDKMEDILRLLYSDAVKCHVIVITHINYLSESFQESDGGARTRVVSSNASDAFGVSRAYPSTIGRALGPRFGRYFNNILETKIEGVGRSARGVIHTLSQGNIAVKTSAPFSLKPSYDTTTGLAEIFAILRNQPEPHELLDALKPKVTPGISPLKPVPRPAVSLSPAGGIPVNPTQANS